MGQRYPLPITPAMLQPAGWPEVAKPLYQGMTDWFGGVLGQDPGAGDAPAALAYSTATASNNYAPRSAKDIATARGVAVAPDITRRRGWIAPNEGIKPIPVAPTVTSLAPNTAAAGSAPLVVTVTGTGFTPWSEVFIGGNSNPITAAVYVSPTTMRIDVHPELSAAGTAAVLVKDHNVLSNSVNFTFT